MTDEPPFTLPDQSPEDAARMEGEHAVNAAIRAMARAASVPVITRPFSPGSSLTISDVDPANGIRFAMMLKHAAAFKTDRYIRAAREAGLGWEQVGEALGLGGATQDSSLAEAAFEYATDAEHAVVARPFDALVFRWQCPACAQMVSDYGPTGEHPADEVTHHAVGCADLAAAVAAYEARWAEEDEDGWAEEDEDGQTGGRS